MVEKILQVFINLNVIASLGFSVVLKKVFIF